MNKNKKIMLCLIGCIIISALCVYVSAVNEWILNKYNNIFCGLNL